MKALEKDRTRRYETANGLAMDVQRYLDGEPVVAAPPEQAYRLRKFVRRHRVLVTAAAAVTAALLLGLVAFAWQAREARVAQRAEAEQHRLADEQRDRAIEAERNAVASEQAAKTARAAAEDNARTAAEQRERAIAAEAEARSRAAELELVADFQAGMLEQIDPSLAGRLLSEDVTARYSAALVRAGVAGDRARRTGRGVRPTVGPGERNRRRPRADRPGDPAAGDRDDR